MGKQTLVLCAGHGGKDAGNTAAGPIERDEVIAVVDDMQRWLRLRGVPQGLGGAVVLDHRLDLAGELTALQAWKLNAADSDLAVDVHLDHKPGASGALVLYNEAPLAKRVAEQFLQRWCQATGIRNNGAFYGKAVARQWRGPQWTNFGFLAVPYPAIIIELGCLNSAHDMQVVRSPLHRALAAQVLYEAWRG